LVEAVQARRFGRLLSAGYTRLMLQIVAQSQQLQRRRGQMTWLASEEKLPAKTHTARPADRGEAVATARQGIYSIPTCTVCTALHDADEEKAASIIAGEPGQLAVQHVMYHYSMYHGALPAGSGAAGAWCRDRSAVARSRQEKTVCGTSQKRSISPGGRPGMRS
jgi:hypothetical protein